MAQASLPPSHGTKRGADNAVVESEQRLAKRFDLLHLDNGGRVYIPISHVSSATHRPSQGVPTVLPAIPPSRVAAAQRHSSSTSPPTTTLTSLSPTLSSPPSSSSSPATTPLASSLRPPPPTTLAPRSSHPSASSATETMELDPSPYNDNNNDTNNHRVYIHSLDIDSPSESSDLDPTDIDGPIFVPEIERHLSRIPAIVLQTPASMRRAMGLDDPGDIDIDIDDEQHAGSGGAGRANKGKELVLWSEGPRSISVPEERDGVRKAILESRKRRTANLWGSSGGGGASKIADTSMGENALPKSACREGDADAMDIG